MASSALVAVLRLSMLHQIEVTLDFDAFGVLEVSEQCEYMANSRPGMKTAVLALAGLRARHMARPVPASCACCGEVLVVVRLGRPTSNPQVGQAGMVSKMPSFY